MARPIDADRLLQVLETNFGHTGGADVMRQLIDAQPTLTPPNEWVSVEDGLPEHSGLFVDRLAAYEDTGLEPEEIKSLQAEWSVNLKVLDEYRKLGSVALIHELVQANKDGRCVVLPCKPSDITVYQLRNKKHALGRGVHPRHVGSTSVWGNGRFALHHQGADPCMDKDFGKTWFLNKEEAEQALKEDK